PYASTSALVTLSLHDALPICVSVVGICGSLAKRARYIVPLREEAAPTVASAKIFLEAIKPSHKYRAGPWQSFLQWLKPTLSVPLDRKSTRLNSSHLVISYAVF